MEYADCFGLKLSRVCLGCVSFSGHDYGTTTKEDCRQTVRAALDVGVNCFDTADIYGFGRSEEILGESLTASDDAVIITKFGVKRIGDGNAVVKDLNPKEMREGLEKSLKRLRRDYVDIYLMHWYDGKTNLDDVMEVLINLKTAGKIRVIGCSNFEAPLLAKINNIEAMGALQMSYNLAQWEHAPLLKDAYQKKHWLTMAYNVLLQGFFTGKYDSTSRFHGTDLRLHSQFFQDGEIEKNFALLEKLKQLAVKYSKTTAQIAIRYVLDAGCIACAVVGAKTAQQAIDNTNVCDFRLSDADVSFLQGGE